MVFYFLFTFSRKPTKPDVPKGPPFEFFSTVRLFFENFLMSPKRPPSRFLIFCNGMYVNRSRRVPSPFYFFRHYATFSERKIFFENFKFFSKKLFCAFLSPRYGADFRRSRVVCYCSRMQKSFQIALSGLSFNFAKT